MRPQSVRRADFVKKFVAMGLEVVEAGHVYDTMMSVFEDAIVSGKRISLGHVGSLLPVKLQPKLVHMGFQRMQGGKIQKTSREYILGRRIRYKFNVHKSFLKRHEVNWV